MRKTTTLLSAGTLLGAGLAVLMIIIPSVAAAQFAADAQPHTLRQAMKRKALADLAEGDSGLVAGPLSACTTDQALFISATSLTADHAQAGENYRIRKLPGNAVDVETVTADESAYPRLKMALGLALTGRESDCASLMLPENNLLRVAAIDGAASASALLERSGAFEEKPIDPAGPSAATPTGQSAQDQLRGWKLTREAAKGGVLTALVATLEPRSQASGDTETPQLKLRCENDAVTLSIRTANTKWQGRPEVTLRIAEGRVTAYRWRTSEDGHEVGLWSSAESIPFLEKLPDNTGLFARIRDAGSVYAEFDLGDLAKALERIRNDCTTQ